MMLFVLCRSIIVDLKCIACIYFQRKNSCGVITSIFMNVTFVYAGAGWFFCLSDVALYAYVLQMKDVK